MRVYNKERIDKSDYNIQQPVANCHTKKKKSYSLKKEVAANYLSL